MKWFKRLFILLLGGLLFAGGIYYFGPKFVANQVLDHVTAELETSGQMEVVRQEVQKNPTLQSYLEEGKVADRSTLPFQTKEEAIRALMPKFQVSELNELQQSAQKGMTIEQQERWLQKLESRLTEEELLAVKALFYDELYGHQ